MTTIGYKIKKALADRKSDRPNTNTTTNKKNNVGLYVALGDPFQQYHDNHQYMFVNNMCRYIYKINSVRSKPNVITF